MTDSQLLAEFTGAQSHDAFAALVRRYIDLVYSVARRMVKDGHLAEDVAQAVFIVLAKKAKQVNPATLPGWLVNTARLASQEARRSRRCRQRHESGAAQMRSEIEPARDEPAADDLMPLLDEALSRLNDGDRTAVVARFLQGRSFADVGAAMGTSEDAARKRVARAVEKLRSIFMKKGIVPSIGGLMVVLASQQASRAPAALIDAVCRATVKGTDASTILVKSVIAAMKLSKMKLAAVIILLMFLIAGMGLGIQMAYPVVAGALLPSSSATAPTVLSPALQAFAANFDRGRAAIGTLYGHFDGKYEINPPQSKSTVVLGHVLWALDGQKEMLEKDIDDVTGEYVKSVFDGVVRCDIEGPAGSKKQAQLMTRPNFNITNVLDRYFFGVPFFRQTLTDYLQDLAQHGCAISIDRREDNGHAIAVVTWASDPKKPEKFSGSLWFDTEKHAVIRFEGSGAGRPEVVDTIDELREVSPNLWVPVTFTKTILERTPSGQTRWTKRMTYTARDLQVNGPVPASLFDTTPPANSFVQDIRSRR